MAVPSVPVGLATRLCAVPDDAEAWQVFADRLLDSGDLRGELVRLRQAISAPWLRDSALRHRLRELEPSLGSAWVTELPNLPVGWSFGWRDGFAVVLRARLEEGAELSGLPALLTEVRSRPAGLLCARLELHGALAEVQLRTLAMALDLPVRVVGLGLTETQLERHGLAMLGERRGRVPLRELRLAGRAITPDALAGSPLVDGLDHLGVTGRPLGDAVGRLAERGAFRAVRRLAITNAGLDGYSLLALLADPTRLPALRCLDLTDNRVNFDLFFRRIVLPEVEEVVLRGNRLHAEAPKWVLRTFPNVRVLDLSGARVSSLRWLASAPRLEHLRMRASLADWLDRPSGFETLRTLDLEGSSTTEATVEALLASSELPALETLGLSGALPPRSVARLSALRPGIRVLA